MSLYNKYRPKTFDNLIKNKFTQNLTKENLTHHAYLLFGASGSGKTSCARLCMAEFKEPDEDIDLFISGKHPDYHEISAAVNNGVDDIRELISNVVNTVPVKSKYKFIVLDESHMLSTAAQNALLKIIEEPPPHIKFFFCTTEINKVLPTIRSRCQLIPFFKINDEGLITILHTICKGEEIKYSDESLKMLISFSEGSARTAINLLEQCSGSLNDPEATAQILGTSSINNFKALTQFICQKDKIKSLSLLDELFNNSVDPASLMNRYADYIADLIIQRIMTPEKCEFEGKKLLIISDCVINVLKDFKILQNIKLISRVNILRGIEKI